MEYRYKQLEAELSGLSKVLADLGARLSEAGKEVTASAVLPSEKLLEQVSASRANFESVRNKVHGHAAAMLVTPLPKPVDLTSIAAIGSLLRAAATSEEIKFSTEGEREQALKTLARALTLAHREVPAFKPLQECHAKLADLRNAIYNVAWPQRHPESESLAASTHPASALLRFVENLEAIEDEQWMALEATITGAYGKPLFVAASRGKLEIGAEAKPVAEPKAEVKAETKPPEPGKPATAEGPAEKPAVAEKVPEKPVVAPAADLPAASAPTAAQPTLVPKKIVTPAASTAPPAVAPAVAVTEKKDVAQEKAPEKAPLPQPVSLTALRMSPEKREAGDKPQPVAQTPPAVVAAPAAVAASPVPRSPAATPAPVAVAPPEALPAPPRPAPPAVAAATSAATPTTPPIPAAPIAETNSYPPPASAAPASATLNSLSALASVTEPVIEKRPQLAPKSEPSGTSGLETGEEQKSGDGDAQRPQRWGFWRGNR